MSEYIFTTEEINEIIDLLDEAVYSYGVECNCGADQAEYPNGCFGTCTRASLLALKQRLHDKRIQVVVNEAHRKRQEQFAGAVIHSPFGANNSEILEIISVHNYGTEDRPDWYIEAFVKTPYVKRIYQYWKQSIDGGWLEFKKKETDNVHINREVG